MDFLPSRATEHEYPSYLRVSSFERVSAAADKQFPDADARDKSAEEPLWGTTPPALTRVVVKRILRERIQGYGLTWKRIAAGFMYQEDGGSGRLSPSGRSMGSSIKFTLRKTAALSTMMAKGKAPIGTFVGSPSRNHVVQMRTRLKTLTVLRY